MVSLHRYSSRHTLPEKRYALARADTRKHSKVVKMHFQNQIPVIHSRLVQLWIQNRDTIIADIHPVGSAESILGANPG